MPDDVLPVQAVLFDIGNVLLKFDFDRAAHAMAPFSHSSAAEIRLVLDSWQLRHESGEVPSEDFTAGARRQIGFTGSDEVFGGHFCDIFTPNEPMWEFARTLFGKIPVYLFSNISRLHEAWVFEQYPEFSKFDGGFYSWRVGAMKPHPKIYDEAVRTLGLPPGRIGYMDDVAHNVAGGLAAGFRTLQYDPDRHGEFLEAAQSWFTPAA